MSIVDRTSPKARTPTGPEGRAVGGAAAGQGTTQTGHGASYPGDGGPRWQLLLPGAQAAAGSWLVLALPALVVWVVTPLTTVTWTQAAGVAGAGWFLAHGLPVHVAAAQVSIAPLGLTALLVAMAVRSVGRLLDRCEAEVRAPAWGGVLARRVLPGYALGYVAVALLAWLLTLAGAARPSPLAVLGVLWVPALALVAQLARRHARGEDAAWAGRHLQGAPRWLTRAVWPGLLGALALLGLGMLVVVVMVALRFSTVAQLQSALGAGVVGGVVLTLGQLLVLPDLGVWVVGWVSGPGFGLGEGATVTLAGAHPGLLPLVPVLGAVPSRATFPTWLLAVLAVPVIVGYVVAWRACAPLARLTSWRTKLATSVTAAGVSALTVGLAGVLGSGSLGVQRLQHVGVTTWIVVPALLGELLVGTMVFVGVDRLRQRRA